MTAERIEIVARVARLAFMALVTAVMLALTFEQAWRGPAGLGQAAVYALVAGFGLEYVRSEWRAGAGGARPARQHES